MCSNIAVNLIHMDRMRANLGVNVGKGNGITNNELGIVFSTVEVPRTVADKFNSQCRGDPMRP